MYRDYDAFDHEYEELQDAVKEMNNTETDYVMNYLRNRNRFKNLSLRERVEINRRKEQPKIDESLRKLEEQRAAAARQPQQLSLFG